VVDGTLGIATRMRIETRPLYAIELDERPLYTITLAELELLP